MSLFSCAGCGKITIVVGTVDKDNSYCPECEDKLPINDKRRK